MQEACTLTWDEPRHCSQPRSFFQLWQGAETSCFLSHFQMALLILHGEGWMPSSSFLGAELARFCPLSALLAGGGGSGGTERGGRGGVWKGQGQSAARMKRGGWSPRACSVSHEGCEEGLNLSCSNKSS